MVDTAAVRGAVEQVGDPVLGRPLAELGMVRHIDVDGELRVVVSVPMVDYPRRVELVDAVSAAIADLHDEGTVKVELIEMGDEERKALVEQLRPQGRQVTVGAPGSGTRVIAISSGKGGVGKSSITTNLGVALAQRGHSVGVLDADVWGFSIPGMLGLDEPPVVLEDMLIPPEGHGVRAISMDYFVGPDQAVIWRGPMLHKALEQFLADVYWNDPDFLLVDMPPGTGDVSISVSQFVPRAQAVIVTTPQATAQRVALRAGLMARKVDQEIMGVVENMSWFTGNDGQRYRLFGQGGGAVLAEELEVPLLSQIPFLPAVREGADEGVPVTVAEPTSEASSAFADLAAEVEDRKPRVRTHPELVIR